MTIVSANFDCKCEDICCPHCGTVRRSITMSSRDQRVLCLNCAKYFIVSIFFTIPLPDGGLRGRKEMTPEEFVKLFTKKLESQFLNVMYDFNQTPEMKKEMREIPVFVLQKIFITGGIIALKVLAEIKEIISKEEEEKEK